MYKIRFYADKEGNRPVVNWLKELMGQKDKENRIRYAKVNDYIEALKQYGTAIGEPHVKKLDGDIWELRPTNDRILFAAWTWNEFVIICHFVKKTQKTPPREIAKAKRLLKEYRERSEKGDG